MNNETIDVIFIGGPCAGKLDRLPRGAKLWHERSPQLNLLNDAEARLLSEQDRNFEYIREDITMENGHLHVFRPSTWSQHQVVLELVNGYRKGCNLPPTAPEEARG